MRAFTPILTARQMRRCDAYTIRETGVPSHILMERAAAALVRCIDSRPALFPAGQVLILCGGGNNGGDGFAAARRLATGQDCTARPVAVLYLGQPGVDGTPDPTRMSGECARQYALATAAGVPVCTPEALDRLLPVSTAVLDAVFGIGLDRAAEGVAADVFRAVNAAGLPVLAADIPSGVMADTGAVPGDAIRAAVTVTMQALKPGLLLYPGADLCGEVLVADLGIATAQEETPWARLADGELLRTVLPPRQRRTNKGSYGRLALVCGSTGMAGAALLSASAALRTGAGLAHIVTPEGNRAVLQAALPEAILTPYGADPPALPHADGYVVGCGLGTSASAYRVLEAVLQAAEASAPVPCPTVLDADALNLLAAHPQLWDAPMLRNPIRAVVLTPHPAEMARLTGLSVSAVLADLPGIASDFARLHGVTVVLKDAHTVIAAPDGAIWLSVVGNAGMARGGSGDLLAGVIGSLLVQARDRLRDGSLSVAAVAAAGVYLHGAAGDRCAAVRGEYGMLPSDILPALSDVTRGLSDSRTVLGSI